MRLGWAIKKRSFIENILMSKMEGNNQYASTNHNLLSFEKEMKNTITMKILVRNIDFNLLDKKNSIPELLP